MSEIDPGVLYQDTDVTIRRYQTGRYGLTVQGLRVVFSTVRTPPTTSIHEFRDGKKEIVGSIQRSSLPHRATLELDRIENTVSETDNHEET